MPTPISAPATIPTLNTAWNRGIIERLGRRSTSAPWMFIATSQTPLDTPSRKQPTTTGATPNVTPMPIVASAVVDPMAAAVSDRRAPKRWTIVPAAGSTTNEPSAMTRITRPSCDGSRSRRVRSCGIRAAQLDTPNPIVMKTA